MALTVADLIARRDEIKNGRKSLYDIETSLGTITVKPPSLKVMDEVVGHGGRQNDIELIFLPGGSLWRYNNHNASFLL